MVAGDFFVEMPPHNYGGDGSPAGQGPFAGPIDSLQIAAATDMTAPGVGIAYEQFRQRHLNSLGQLAFHARLTDFRNGIWSGAPDNLAVVALTGSEAPGANGANFGGMHPFVFDDLQFNDQGQTGFTAMVLGAGVTPDNNSGLWLGPPGQLQIIAREGDLAPRLADGISYSDLQSFAEVALNNAGQMGVFGLAHRSGRDQRQRFDALGLIRRPALPGASRRRSFRRRRGFAANGRRHRLHARVQLKGGISIRFQRPRPARRSFGLPRQYRGRFCGNDSRAVRDHAAADWMRGGLRAVFLPRVNSRGQARAILATWVEAAEEQG